MNKKIRFIALLTAAFAFSILLLPMSKETAQALPNDKSQLPLEQINNEPVMKKYQRENSNISKEGTEQDGSLLVFPSDYQPATSIKFGKESYKLGEFIKVTMTIDESVVDIEEAILYVGQYSNDFAKFKYIDLQESSPGVFEGMLEVTTYFNPGKYNIESVLLFSADDLIDIYDKTYSEYYGVEDTRVENYEGYFNITGTIEDNVLPTIHGVSIDRTMIGKNESLTITVVAKDDLSGVKGGYLTLMGENGDYRYEEMKLISKNTWEFKHKPSAIDATSSKYTVDEITIFDVADNYADFYSPEDFKPISFDVSGYENIGEISGANRYDTAIEISKYFYEVDTVIIALGTDFPDALSAGPLSSALNAPILLTQKNNISNNTLNEIKRLGATEAIILGGPNAISEDIRSQLKSAGIEDIQRIYGKDRYATATAVGEYLFEIQSMDDYKSEFAVLASGNSFADALAVSSMASEYGRPILLTKMSELDASTKKFLEDENIQYVSVIGGTSVISDKVIEELELLGIIVRRHAGGNRYETSSIIAKNFFPDSTIAFVSNGLNFADALAAAPLAAMNSAPILLTNDSTLPTVIKTYLHPIGSEIEHVTVVGGNSAVSDYVKRTMSEALLGR